MEKFQNYSEMLTQFEDTAMGRAQQLDERLSMVGKTFVEQLAGGFKSIAEYIIKLTGQYVDKDANGSHVAPGLSCGLVVQSEKSFETRISNFFYVFGNLNFRNKLSVCLQCRKLIDSTIYRL